MSSRAFVCVLLIDLHFPEASDLKGKRKQLRSIKERLRGRYGASVSEVDHHDRWQRATLAAAFTGRTAGELAAFCDEVERWLLAHVADGGVRVERTLVSLDDLVGLGDPGPRSLEWVARGAR